MISPFLSTGRSVQICINLKWQTKKNGLIVIKVFKRAQEKQSESFFKLSIKSIHSISPWNKNSMGYMPINTINTIKQNVLIVIKVFKRAQEKQSESLSKPSNKSIHSISPWNKNSIGYMPINTIKQNVWFQ